MQIGTAPVGEPMPFCVMLCRKNVNPGFCVDCIPIGQADLGDNI